MTTPVQVNILSPAQVGADPATAFVDIPVPLVGASSLMIFPYRIDTRVLVNVTYGPWDGTNIWIIATNTGAASGSAYNVGAAFPAPNNVVRVYPTASIGAGNRLQVLGTWRMG